MLRIWRHKLFSGNTAFSQVSKQKQKREEFQNRKMGKIKGVKKHRKTEIVFDESKRRDFLTGFRKRKEERRQKAKVEHETKIKAEIKLAK